MFRILAFKVRQLVLVFAALGAAAPATAWADDVFRVVEYDIDAADGFTGTTFDLGLTVPAAGVGTAFSPNYFVLVRGADTEVIVASDTTGPDPRRNYVRLVGDCRGTGDLTDINGAAGDDGCGAGDSPELRLQRAVGSSAGNQWEGTITVVENLVDPTGFSAPNGFRLVDVKEIVMPAWQSGDGMGGPSTAGTVTSAAWDDVAQVVPFGGFNGAGCEVTSVSGAGSRRLDFTSCWVELTVSGTNTVTWSRVERDNGLPFNSADQVEGATTTVMVVEWGTGWTVQTVTDNGSTDDPENPCDMADLNDYDRYPLGTSVERSDTWLWGTGGTNNNGTGDGAEGVVYTIGDGVSDDDGLATQVAVGFCDGTTSDVTVRNFTIYVMTHADAVVDHEFSPLSGKAATTKTVTMDRTFTGDRFSLSATSISNSSSRDHQQAHISSLFTAPNVVTLRRERIDTDASASSGLWGGWVQGIEFDSIATPTRAVVSDMRWVRTAEGPAIEWSTSSEEATLGFVLHRRGPDGRWHRVHDGLVPPVNAAQGGTYRVIDPAAAAGTRYALEEVELSGKARAIHEQILAPSPAPLRGELAVVGGMGRMAHPVPAEQQLRRWLERTLEPGSVRSLRAPSTSSDRALVHVASGGLQFVSAEALASALGRSAVDVRDGIAGDLGRVTRMGHEVSVLPAGTAGLYFFAPEPTSRYGAHDVYELTMAPRRDIAGRQPVQASSRQSTWFMDEVTAEENLVPMTAVVTDPWADVLAWAYLAPGLPAVSLALDVPGPARTVGGRTELEVALHGATGATHVVEVALNGTSLGQASFDGAAAHTARFSVRPDQLHDGANSVTVQAIETSSASGVTPASAVLVDRLVLRYPRELRATGGALALSGAGLGQVTVTGVNPGPALALDVTDPRAPRQVALQPAGDAALAFQAGAAEARFWVGALSAAHRPRLAPAPRAIAAADLQARWVMITPEALSSAARPLAEHRAQQGLAAAVVSLESIYDSYNHGQPHPDAIKRFVRDAVRRHGNLRYVVLGGDGSYDHLNALGFADDLVPAVLRRSEHGLFADDGWYGDVGGSAPVVVGRLPAQTPAELERMTAKLIAFEEGADYAHDALLLADRADRGGNFAASMQAMAARLEAASQTPLLVDLGAVGLDVARHEALSALHQGSRVLGLFGHSGFDRFGGEGLLRAEDADELTGAPALVLGSTCLVGRSEVAGHRSLGEQLLAAEGGAAAIWAPAGLAYETDSTGLLLDVVDSLGEASPTDVVRLGDLIAGAALVPGADRAGMALLGDPALRLSAGAGTALPSPPGHDSTDSAGEAPAHRGGCSLVPGAAGTSYSLAGLLLAALLIRRRRR